MKILWMSRHKPLPSQIIELERLFGTVEVVQDPKPFSSAEDILGRFRQGGYSDIVVVAPLSVLARLVDLGVKPLWAEMSSVSESAEVMSSGRGYRFDRFRRVKALRMEFEEL